MLKSVEILGLRGFASSQTLRLATPNGQHGSGLTVIVGANNSGKSTAIEALRAVAQRDPPSFTQGRRNQVAGDQVTIRVVDTNDRATTLKSIRPGSSETVLLKEQEGVDLTTLLVLPARRVFNPYFGRSVTSRSDYMANVGFPSIRSSSMDQFTYRLFAVEKNRQAFDDLLRKVVDPVPEWSIDQMDSGQYFLKVKKGDATHSSEGLGEGLVSLLYIIDALYDSKEGDIIAIDEPELSLHPALQRKLATLFLEYATSRQLVISTHSPYFVGLEALANGATVARVHVEKDQSCISQLTAAAAGQMAALIRNENNPHILGHLAQEVLFLDDKIVLIEGQEDVIFFRRVESATTRLEGNFFGWGVGGAENMTRIATLLHGLGFKKVVGILDANKADVATRLSEAFPNYHFFAIPANDVRTKGATQAKAAVIGLLNDANDAVRPEYREDVLQKINAANRYFRA